MRSASLLAILLLASSARADLPSPRLDRVAPLGAASGSSVEIEVLGADMTIRFDFVETLPLGRTGKAQTCISKIPLPLFSTAAAEVWEEEERRALAR